MHAVVATVTINDPEAGLDRLRDDVVPQVKQIPGLVAVFFETDDGVVRID